MRPDPRSKRMANHAVQMELERNEARSLVTDMEIRHSATMMHTQTIVDEANALRDQMRENPWCAACREPDCCVSMDGTCAMIRKYLANTLLDHP